MTQSGPNGSAPPRTRWTFVRDVLLLQWKLVLGNVHNLVLIPLTLVAALLDLVFRTGAHGSRFYRVLGWGRQAEEAIGLYRALDGLEDETEQSDTQPRAAPAAFNGAVLAAPPAHEALGTVSAGGGEAGKIAR